MRPEATVQRRGNRSAPDFSWLFASSVMYVASLTGMTREKRNHIRHHQPQKPTVRESGVAPSCLAIVVATFPTAPLEIADPTAFQWVRYKLIHLGSALTFLSLTGLIAWRFFAKRDPSRTRIYRLLSGGIWVTLGLGIVTRMFLQGQDGLPDLITNHGVWVVEFVSVTLFGIAWWISARDPTPSGTTEAS